MRTKEVAIKPTLKILLESDAKALSEQIVVAYGTATKESFTGSAKVVGSKTIAETQKSNAIEAIQGKVAGVQMFQASGQPGQSSPAIYIRGISSISAGNQPLIVVDGAPFSGNMNSINPGDIESMTVLKDAASNALYGSRGANGVIMITTKKAKSGNPARITVDAKWGQNSRAQKRYKTINTAAGYYEAYYTALNNYYTAQGMDAQAANIAANNSLISGDRGLQYNVYNVPEGQQMIGLNGKLNPNATMGNVVNGYMLMADDWYDASYKNSLRQEYTVTASQANANSNFYLSFNYLNNKGITNNSDYERYVGRLRAETQLLNWLKVGANVNYTHQDANYMANEDSGSSGNVFAYATSMAPIYPLYVRDAQGNIMKDAYDNTMYDYGTSSKYAPYIERPVLPGGNALSDTYLDTNYYFADNLHMNGFAEIKFLKDFKFTTSNTIYVSQSRGKSYNNGFYGSYAESKGMLGVSHSTGSSMNFLQTIDWHHDFNGHDVTILVGHENYLQKSKSLSGQRHNIFSPDYLELDACIEDSKNAGSSASAYETEGWIARALYDYQTKYFASVSFRRDASTIFAPEHRWGNFWSAGAGWLIHKESWFNADWVNMLKIKASYGEQGNDGIGNYLYTDRFYLTNVIGNIAATPSSTDDNREISWETQGNFNTGVDFELFNSRLNGTIDFFYRKTGDMLYLFTLPASLGYTGYYANVGDMRNRGVEVDLNADIIRTKNLTWSVDLNATYYRNKVISMPEERKTMTVYDKNLNSYEGFASSNYFYGVDLSLNSWYMPEYAGVYSASNYCGEYDPKLDGSSMWYRTIVGEDGKPTGREMTTKYADASDYILGSSIPDLYGGFGTHLTWKGLDFGINFSYQIGGKAYDGQYASLMASPSSGTRGDAMHADLANSWTASNTNTDIPRFQYGDVYSVSRSSRFLTDASYLSINNINIGYTFPRSLTRKIGVDNIRVYAAADNVYYWSKRQGLDPRQSLSGSTSQSLYSPIRTISGGITVDFSGTASKTVEPAQVRFIEKEVVKEVPVVKEVVKEVPAKATTTTVQNTYVVTFEVNSAEIKNNAELAGIPAGSTVEIVAYASPEGNADANIALSQRRADAVAEYLKSKGINVVRVSAKGADTEHANRIAIVTVK